MENGTQITLLELDPNLYQRQNVTVSDFRARLSALRDIEEDLKILEELYSLKSCGLLKKDTLKYYSLKMSPDCLTMRGGSPSKSSSKQWQNWGILWNGKCVTASILESRKTESECSLSDILEPDTDEKYFLSEYTIDRLMSYKDSEIITE